MTDKTDSKERDLMALVDAYAEARHIGGCHTYNAKTAEARNAVIAKLAASAGSEPVAQAKGVFEFWWADHMPNATQAEAWREWCELMRPGPVAVAHPSPPEGMVGGWRPMADAPRDGTSVIAVNAATNPGRQHIVRFEDRRPHQPWRTGAGPMDWVAGLTHWMPLPPPPTTSAGSGKGD